VNIASFMEGYAIVGIACRYPGIRDADSYWQALLKGESLLTEMRDPWASRYYNQNQDRSNPRESYSTIYTKIYGSISEDSWLDCMRFAFPPNLIEGDPSQYLCLQVAAEAMADALRGRSPKWIPSERTGVVVGMGDHPQRGIVGALMNGMILEHVVDILGDSVGVEIEGSKRKELRALLASEFLKGCDPAITPNLISNVVSGTIANKLGLLGPNYLVDGACTSGMIAVDHAVKQLDSGDTDLMLVGGVQATMNFPIYQLFCTINGLSEKGIYPMSKTASGTILSEGVGFIAIKRLSDAVEAGDKIYSVIKSVALASDGKGEGLMAPNQKGQVVAMKRAYDKCEINPEDISLLEVHATGIPHGDNTELSSILEVFSGCKQDLSTIAISSIKSLIGHTIPASGIASIIKTSLALQNKIIPPSICPDPRDNISDHSSPFYINREIRRWFHKSSKERVAAINSFGFGGINGHLILSEYKASGTEPNRPQKLFPYKISKPSKANNQTQNKINNDKSGRTYENLLEYRQSGYTTTCRAIFCESVDREELISLLTSIDIEKVETAIVAKSLLKDVDDSQEIRRIAIFGPTKVKLQESLNKAIDLLRDDAMKKRHRDRGFTYTESSNLIGKVAFLIPGEGVQAPEMLAEITNHIDIFSYWYNFMDDALDRDIPLGLVACMPNSELDCATLANKKRLGIMYSQDTATQLIAACILSFYEIASRIGIVADQIVGHSQGESNAVMLSGSLGMDENSLKERVRLINEYFSCNQGTPDQFPEGAIYAVSGLDWCVLEEILKSRSEWSLISNNCNSQRIVFSEKEYCKELEVKVVKNGGAILPTPLTRPYHTKYFKNGAAMHRKLNNEHPHSYVFEEGQATVYSCLNAKPYPKDYEKGRDIFVDQWLNPVLYENTVKEMYKDGARYFIELGPNTTLTSYTKEVLAEYPDVIAVSLGSPRKDSTNAFLQAISTLWTSGLQVDLNELDQLFKEEYPIGLSQVSRPKKAVQVHSEIPMYNSSGLQEYLDKIVLDENMPNQNERRSTRKPSDFKNTKSEQSHQEIGIGSYDAGDSKPLNEDKTQASIREKILMEHNNTMKNILANADAVTKEFLEESQ